jgi:hypothetical protein
MSDSLQAPDGLVIELLKCEPKRSTRSIIFLFPLIFLRVEVLGQCEVPLSNLTPQNPLELFVPLISSNSSINEKNRSMLSARIECIIMK